MLFNKRLRPATRCKFIKKGKTESTIEKIIIEGRSVNLLGEAISALEGVVGSAEFNTLSGQQNGEVSATLGEHL